MKTVPIEPTQQMYEAYGRVKCVFGDDLEFQKPFIRHLWKSMLEAVDTPISE